MELSKQKFIQWTLLSVTVLFAVPLATAVLAYWDILHIGARALYSPAQVIGLAVLTVLPVAMLAAYAKGYETVAGIMILASNFLLPLYLVDEAFRYSIPQSTWIPFALAIAICSTRWAILTFATTLAVLFVFFPVTEVQYPISTLAATATIFVMLTLGKLLQESLTTNAQASEKAARASEIAMRKSEERYRSVFRHAVEAISVSRIDNGSYLEANDAFFEMSGYLPEEIIGSADAVPKIWGNADQLRTILDRLSRQGEVKNFETCFRRKNGDMFWGLVSSRQIDIDGIRCRITVTHDITEHKKAEERISHLAYFDQLTQLPNRLSFMEKLQQTMEKNAQSGIFGMLLLIDLDDFKILNDTCGHEIGDLLLKQVADRMTNNVQSGDVVARLGGDEFLVMSGHLGLTESDAAMRAEAIADTISHVLSQEYQLGTEIHRNTASIGVRLFNGDEIGSETLLKQVELAMYRAKHSGKNQIQFFDPAMEVALAKRVAMANDLRDAILQKQFVLHYQAQIVGTQLIGAEVLVRWQHPDRGVVSPAEFIPLAEETGLIVPLGKWVLENACAQLVNWSRDPKFAHLTISVNVSIQQFNHDNFVEQVLVILRKTGANPKRLKLELTESLLALNVDVIIEKMHILKAKGISFSLDDFGTGYSSLSYLKRLPIDQLKIDQSFVRDLLVNPDDVSIAKTIIALGGSLGISVIAEGVETIEHQVFLAKLGCMAYQGYLYGRPMPIDDFELKQEILVQNV